MPTPRDHHAVVSIRGRIYAIGGRLGNMARNLDVCEEYDPVSDNWRTRAPMPTARSGVAFAVLMDRAYVFGGEEPAGTFRENEEYDPVTDTWTARAPMPAGRHGHAAATVGDAIYVLAGGPTPGGSQIGTNEAFSF
jgi:N-acetylneuraminic acid mutarotase